MFAIALGMSPIEKVTVAISASIFIIAFTWVSIKGDLRKLANELIENNENLLYYIFINKYFVFILLLFMIFIIIFS